MAAHESAGMRAGCFVGGALFDNLTSDTSIFREETFGPLHAISARITNGRGFWLYAHEFGEAGIFR
jgi:hypothetical protein